MKTKKGPSANSFLIKLYKILTNADYAEIITWTDDGHSFEIINLEGFVNEILPQYFKHKNFSSFIRQLNMYDFHKVPGDSNIFNHPSFVQGNSEDLSLIHRKNAPVKSKNNPDGEIVLKIRKLKENNEVLEGTVEKLENMYNEVTSFNQVLISHLQKCQDREQQLQELLKLSMNYLKVNK